MKMFKFFGACLLALGLSVSAHATPSLSKISCQHNTFTGAGTDACSVYMNGNVSSTDSVTLTSNDANAALSSSKVYVTSGHQAGVFTIKVASVTTTQKAVITATYGGKSVTYAVTLNASTTSSPTLSNITCPASSFTSQGTDSCSINLSAAATSSETVTVTSNDSSAVPTASVAISSGKTTAGFTVTVAAVTTQQTATITAKMGTSAVNYALTLYPATQHHVSLSWSAPQPNGDTVTGYHVYRSVGSNTLNFSQVSAASATSYVDTNVNAGSSYTYAVRSVDAEGVESVNSNTAVATVPTP